ncbi:MAG: GNAT family N-acetyltransferase [Acidobacteria bacterium]|nr:GNAT family N-acetyltransferase [Acidobacteriota bacterium]
MIAQIRLFRDEDFARLLQIDQVCFDPGIAYDASTLRYFLYHLWSDTLVIERDSEVVGFGIAAVTRRRGPGLDGRIITLDLLPPMRGRGYGRDLLQKLESWLAAEGALAVSLEVDVRNTAAIGFYQRMGYREGRRLKDYYGRGRDALRMERLLAGDV